MCTRTEIALQMGVTNQTITDYINGTQPRWDSGVRLAHYLIREHDYYTLAMQTMLVCIRGKSNGRIDDELLDLVSVIPLMRTSYENRNSGAYQDALGKVKSIFERLKAEGKKI